MRINRLIILLALFASGCGKSKFTTAPQLQYKSVNTNVLDHNQIIEFTLRLTDKEGDVSAAWIYIKKTVPTCPGSEFLDSMSIPAFPAGSNVDANLTIDYANGVNVIDGNGNVIRNILTPQCNMNDTCKFQFVLRDNAGHLSDTATVDNIVIVN